jgi:hypothetical protein
VENDRKLVKKVMNCLKGLGHKVVHHSSLKIAQDKYNSGFNLVICSASLQRIDDGFEWALKLHRARVKVLLFFRLRVSKIPFLNEKNFSEKNLEKRIKKLLK